MTDCPKCGAEMQLPDKPGFWRLSGSICERCADHLSSNLTDWVFLVCVVTLFIAFAFWMSGK